MLNHTKKGFFSKLKERGKLTFEAMRERLSSCFENVEGEYAGVGHPQWWVTGGKASGQNAGATGLVLRAMAKALNEHAFEADIEV